MRVTTRLGTFEREARNMKNGFFTLTGLLTRASLKDKLSLFYAVFFPVALMIGLSFAFTDSYDTRLFTGTIAMGVFFFAFWGLAFETVMLRNQGVFKLLRFTPFKTRSFVLSLSLAKSVTALFSSLILAVFGFFLLSVSIVPANILLMLPVLLLGVLTFLMLGVFVGNMSQKETQVSLLANIVGMPMLFISDAFYSLGNTPAWLQTISRVSPFQHLVDGVRAALVADTLGVAMSCLILTGFFTLSLFVAVKTFRWEPAK